MWVRIRDLEGYLEVRNSFGTFQKQIKIRKGSSDNLGVLRFKLYV